MNVREIVKKYLQDNGYDGLECDGCFCTILEYDPLLLLNCVYDIDEDYSAALCTEQGYSFLSNRCQPVKGLEKRYVKGDSK